MQGVEILTSLKATTEWAFNWPVFWIVFGLVFGICLITGIWTTVTSECEWTIIPFLSIVGIVIGSVCGCGLGNSAHIPTTYETQYKVTISEEVSMTDFYEHYEVIDQDGKIFTVREKSDE
jgi:hypothetical protein